MTTDELRAWMKALEERDVRIVALEKRLHLLELSCYAKEAAEKPQVPCAGHNCRCSLAPVGQRRGPGSL